MKHTAALLCAALSFAAPPVSGQVVIGGNPAIVYGGYPYRVYAPYAIVDPWATVPGVPRIPDAAPACYRIGRCSPADVAAYRYRVERLDRLAPAAPPETRAPDPIRPPSPPPTAVEDIRPEYQGSSMGREEYRKSGRPIDGRR
jgi:hypothetical protein